MAITLEANYSKKLGLPGFSSHQYSVTIKTELGDIKQVETESARLYALLQGCVDRDIQATGFLPANGNGNGNGNNSHAYGPNGQTNISNNGHNGHHGNGNSSHGNNESWSCSDKQKALIIKIVEDNHLDKQDIESLAQGRFGKGIKQLNKLEASGLIEELLEQHGKNNGGHNRVSRFQKARTA